MWICSYRVSITNQILSFHISLASQKSEVFLSFSIDSSLNLIECIVIDELSPTIPISLVTNLSFLPHLFSLIIDMRQMLSESSEFHRLIFALSKLKYIKYIQQKQLSYSSQLPIVTDEQFSAIGYLVINYHCTFNELRT
ncbi:unnamed protein product [Rotaria sp. Silwood1]|nr:unnamed protein product [Rotaria sp. Silwood1]CAF3534028.1 unnamed protein product [Rotaria sp. Silwood1]CAF4908144.1 unnamed protein product [Rotaria sp. Silwood1]